MKFGEKVKFVREKLLLSQVELARELNVTPLSVIRWEQNRTEPHFKSRKAFRALCEKNGIGFKEDGYENLP